MFCLLFASYHKYVFASGHGYVLDDVCVIRILNQIRLHNALFRVREIYIYIYIMYHINFNGIV